MGIYDTIMLVVVAAATFIGWRKGMISQLAAIISVVASFMVAATFHQRVSASISAPAPWDRIAAFVLIYVGVSLAVWLVFKQIRNSVKQMQLGDFDQQLGAFLGAAKGAAIVAVITLVSVNLLSSAPKSAVASSRTSLVVSRVVHSIGPMTPPRVQEFLATYVQRLDEAISQPNDPYQPYPRDDGYYGSGSDRSPEGIFPAAPGYGSYPQNSQYLPPSSGPSRR